MDNWNDSDRTISDCLKDRLAQGWIEFCIPVSNSFEKVAEIMDWLEQHVGPRVPPDDLDALEDNGEWDHLIGSFVIKDPKKALLFKLTWCGI